MEIYISGSENGTCNMFPHWEIHDSGLCLNGFSISINEKVVNININHEYVYYFASIPNIDGLAQDCGNSVANALELPRSCAKPSI